MSASAFADQLERFGPHAASAPLTLAEAEEYCRRLARSHYENFTVASVLLPARLRQHFYNVYAYCRWADDLADETDDPEYSLELLNWWQQQLVDAYRGRAQHPVFIALITTIEEFAIPEPPFRDLLIAFRQDQRARQYETFDDLLGYCRNSANPVGRIVLYLGRVCDDENARLSDSICTGLQLANFWQDIARDYDRGRVYLPRETCRRFGYHDEMLSRREYNEAFAAALQFEVGRAREFLQSGRPLVARMPRDLQIDVDLFVRGGLAVLRAIERKRYNVWRSRPTVGKLQKAGLFIRAWLQTKLPGNHGGVASSNRKTEN